jgi:hypothetical protein
MLSHIPRTLPKRERLCFLSVGSVKGLTVELGTTKNEVTLTLWPDLAGDIFT